MAAVVPATDSPPTADLCVAALRACAEPPEEVHVVRDPAGAGPAAARNLGAERSGAELIAFVDADVVVHPDALARARRALVADPGLAAVFGSYDDRPADPGTVSRFRNLLHHHVHTSSPGPADTFWAGLGVVRRDAFVAAGGFDAERFAGPAVEDIDLGMRLRAAGARVLLDPGIRGTHLKRWSLATMVRTDLLARSIPWTRLQLESGRLEGALNLGWRHRMSAVAALAACLAAVARMPRTALAATAGLAALNGRFLVLLARCGGVPLAAAGLPLLLLHHLTAVAGAVAGGVLHLGGRRR